MLTLTVASIMLPYGPAAAGLPDVCGTIAGATERAEGIPEGLVRAVALAESGRWEPTARRSQAWPWTVTASRDTYYLASKGEALRKVEELRAGGRSNIDVGCMQVNLGYHGDAFASLDEALEPASNIAYGAGFLKRLRVQTRSWERATARYHSSDPARGEAYRAKVFRLWQELRHGRVARAPIRLVGAPPQIAPDAPAPAHHLIVPAGAPKPTRPAPGAIGIVRGQ